MIGDFRRREDDGDVATDVCIVGAGAAGISLASSLADSPLRCCVLESGGASFDADIQSLADLEKTGIDDGRTCRLRYFGGTTNHWGGWCAPLNAVDFATRPWVPDSGWPIVRRDLDPYYARAQAVCGLGAVDFSADALGDETRDYPSVMPRSMTRFYQVSTPPKRFGTAYGPALQTAGNVRVLLQANVTHLETDPADPSTVAAARIRTLDGAEGRVRARHFVIACGGIENARLLLLSGDMEQGGLGNANGRVGRYFMQHPHVSCASVATADLDRARRLFAGFEKSGFTVRASVGPSAAQQQRHRILNCSATLDETPDPATGYGALRHVWRDIRAGRWPSELGSHLWSVITDLESLQYGKRWLSLYMRAEQAPDPASRVTLSDALDRLGQRRAVLDWRLSEIDKRTVLIGAKLVGEAFARTGFGRMKLPEWLISGDDGWPPELWGGCHHMGTTRMSASPSTGVVDRDCRLHAVRNVYMAGSSVFPTGGYANPTLTVVALALRLADHLKTLYQ